MNPRRVHLAVALVLGAILLYYGVTKLGDPADFLKSIHAYGILPTQPPWLLNLSAIGLPWLEVISGLALLSGLFRRGAALLSCVVLVVFTAAIAVRAMQVMGADGTPFLELAFDCGCGSGTVIIWQKLLFNTALIVGTAWLVRPAPGAPQA